MVPRAGWVHEMTMPESPDAQMMMALAADIEDAYQLSRRIERRRQLVAQLPQVQAALPPAEPQTVYARPIESEWELTHFERYGRWYLAGGAVVLIGLVGYMVYAFVQWLSSLMAGISSGVATVTAGGAGILGVIALIGLLCLFGGRGGGPDFSGTFSGRLH